MGKLNCNSVHGNNNSIEICFVELSNHMENYSRFVCIPYTQKLISLNIKSYENLNILMLQIK